jgi:4a-hydroxytetrahydrobiopterin dehydratase
MLLQFVIHAHAGSLTEIALEANPSVIRRSAATAERSPARSGCTPFPPLGSRMKPCRFHSFHSTSFSRCLSNLPTPFPEYPIFRTFKFKGFLESIDFVHRIAKKAQKANHHPDIDIRFDKVTLKLTTHDEGGITNKDFSLAQQCEEVLSKSFAP